MQFKIKPLELQRGSEAPAGCRAWEEGKSAPDPCWARGLCRAGGAQGSLSPCITSVVVWAGAGLWGLLLQEAPASRSQVIQKSFRGVWEESPPAQPLLGHSEGSEGASEVPEGAPEVPAVPPGSQSPSLSSIHPLPNSKPQHGTRGGLNRRGMHISTSEAPTAIGTP